VKDCKHKIISVNSSNQIVIHVVLTTEVLLEWNLWRRSVDVERSINQTCSTNYLKWNGSIDTHVICF